MKAPYIWIVFPAIISALLFIISKYFRLVKFISIITTVGLALAAWKLPIGIPLSLGPLPFLHTLKVADTLTVLGRQFIITDNARFPLIIIYLGAAIWFIGATIIDVDRLFIPCGMAIAALLTAAISVDPFLYASLFIGMAVILSVPILSPPGKPVSRGIYRFIIYQILGMILLLVAGSLASQAELTGKTAVIGLPAAIILGLGLAMVITVFPFNFYIPVLMEDNPPYPTAFVFFSLPVILSLFTLSVFSRYPWLHSESSVNLVFSLVGLITVVGAGLWSIFQDDLGRIFGYAVIMEIGLLIIAISQVLASDALIQVEPKPIIAQSASALFFFALLLPRGLNLALWALSLSIIRKRTKQLDFRSIGGIAWAFPFATVSFFISALSLAGYPILAGFPVRVVLGIGLARQFQLLAGVTLLGYFGLIIAALKALYPMLTNNPQTASGRQESWPQIILLGFGCIILVIIGVFPQVFLAGLSSILP
jgi:NADH-quinone oxidoreductase subunit N